MEQTSIIQPSYQDISLMAAYGQKMKTIYFMTMAPTHRLGLWSTFKKPFKIPLMASKRQKYHQSSSTFQSAEQRNLIFSFIIQTILAESGAETFFEVQFLAKKLSINSICGLMLVTTKKTVFFYCTKKLYFFFTVRTVQKKLTTNS